MGYKVVIKNIETNGQEFLNGHTNNVSALCVSPCGEYIASGQNNHLGFKVHARSLIFSLRRIFYFNFTLYQAMVIIWNYKEREIRSSYTIHKVNIADLCFTCNSSFLVSLGGKDDGNIIVWDVQNNFATCGILFTLTLL